MAPRNKTDARQVVRPVYIFHSVSRVEPNPWDLISARASV